MNETPYADSASDATWPHSDHRGRMADASNPSGADKAPQAAVGLVKSATQSAHETIDRLSASATPAARQLGESVSAAGESLQAAKVQLRQTRDEWAESARGSVRRHPLFSVAAAFAVGAVFARITR